MIKFKDDKKLGQKHLSKLLCAYLFKNIYFSFNMMVIISDRSNF